jgi:folate-binding protein YgfZ
MSSLSSEAGYAAARSTAASIDRTHRGRIVVSGRDRASYLQGLFTNDIAALGPGRGCYAAYLTPQGRMITDVWVYELGDVILLELGAAQKDTLLSRLEQFIFSEDVQLGDATETFFSIAIVGPRAAAVVGRLTGVARDRLDALPPHGNLRAAFAEQPVIVLRIVDTGVAGFELLVEASFGGLIQNALTMDGVVAAGEAVADMLRIEAGVPLFGRDMNEETIPLEAGLETTAISMTKGCYVGQEVIVRVLHRGHGRVARKLAGLVVDGSEAPAPGAVVTIDGRDVGVVTSATVSPALNRPIALAYLHRDFQEAGTVVRASGATAVVTPLPFVDALPK